MRSAYRAVFGVLLALCPRGFRERYGAAMQRDFTDDLSGATSGAAAFAYLDTHNGELVMELLDELHRAGSTILMVTHDSRFHRYADRTISLLDGAIIASTDTTATTDTRETTIVGL